MRYKNMDLDLKGYYKVCMIEEGFYDCFGNDLHLDKVGGYFKTEAECGIISDYISSCGLEKPEDIEYIKELGYSPAAFIDEKDDI